MTRKLNQTIYVSILNLDGKTWTDYTTTIERLLPANEYHTDLMMVRSEKKTFMLRCNDNMSLTFREVYSADQSEIAGLKDQLMVKIDAERATKRKFLPQ
jgi:hypothetical protein